MFKREQLEKLYKKDLKDLADYYDIEYPIRIRKDELIDKIVEHFRVEKEANEPPKSVRIKRLEELNK